MVFHSDIDAVRVARVFDPKAATWSEKGKWAKVTKGNDCPLDSLAAQMLFPGATVLDIGGGDGRFSASLAASTPIGRVILVDVSRAMAETAAMRLASLKIGSLAVVADASASVPLPAETADVIVLRHILHHVTDPGVVLSETRRLLRPGGVALIQVPGKHFLHQWLPYSADGERDSLGRFTETEMSELLSSAGLVGDVWSESFRYEFENLLAVFRHLASVGTLEKLVRYMPNSAAVIQNLLDATLVESILRNSKGKIIADCDYVVAVARKSGER